MERKRVKSNRDIYKADLKTLLVSSGDNLEIICENTENYTVKTKTGIEIKAPKDWFDEIKSEVVFDNDYRIQANIIGARRFNATINGIVCSYGYPVLPPPKKDKPFCPEDIFTGYKCNGTWDNYSVLNKLFNENNKLKQELEARNSIQKQGIDERDKKISELEVKLLKEEFDTLNNFLNNLPSNNKYGAVKKCTGIDSAGKRTFEYVLKDAGIVDFGLFPKGDSEKLGKKQMIIDFTSDNFELITIDGYNPTLDDISRIIDRLLNYPGCF